MTPSTSAPTSPTLQPEPTVMSLLGSLGICDVANTSWGPEEVHRGFGLKEPSAWG